MIKYTYCAHLVADSCFFVPIKTMTTLISLAPEKTNQPDQYIDDIVEQFTILCRHFNLQVSRWTVVVSRVENVYFAGASFRYYANVINSILLYISRVIVC